MTSNNTLKDVYLNRVSAFLPNAPVGNDEMEAVLGMAGDVPSRVRRMILRSNGICRAITPSIPKAAARRTPMPNWPPKQSTACLPKVFLQKPSAAWPAPLPIPTKPCPDTA